MPVRLRDTFCSMDKKEGKGVFWKKVSEGFRRDIIVDKHRIVRL